MATVAPYKAIKWKVSFCEELEVVEPSLVERKIKDNFSPIVDPDRVYLNQVPTKRISSLCTSSSRSSTYFSSISL